MRRNWNDPSSKYGLQPEKFDDDIRANEKRYSEKKAKVNETLDDLMHSDPTRQEETFSMIIAWAREWRRLNGRPFTENRAQQNKY